jgi:hypothetical protein
MRQKTPIPFAEWAPDQSKISGNGNEFRGCIRQGGRYAPLQDLKQIRAGSQIADICLGAKTFYDGDSAPIAFCGDAGELYRIIGKMPVSVSKAGGYAASEDWAWTFEQFGQNIIAVARGVPPQRYTIGSSSVFADLATAPAADVAFRIRQHLFLVDGRNLYCSGFNDITDWTFDTATNSFQTEIPHAAGLAVAGWSGEQGVLFQERGILRIAYTGGTVPFNIDEIEGGRGLCGPNAWSPWGKVAFCVAEDGFYTFDGLSSSNIGQGRVDQYFANNLNYGYRHRVWAQLDASRKSWMIGFPTAGSTICNEVLIYSFADDKWTHDEIDTHLGFEMHREPINADDEAGLIAAFGTANSDAAAFANISADSPLFRESRKQWAAFDADRKLCLFDGVNREAVLSTGTFQPIPGMIADVTELWPVCDVDSGLVEGAIAWRRKRLSETETVSPFAPMNDDGFCPVMAEGRYLRGIVRIMKGARWTEANGVFSDGQPAGEF